MIYETTGRLVFIGETQQVTDTFKKRVFRLETSDTYPQTIEFEMVQDKTEQLNFRKVGEEVKVKFDIQGRISGERCFNTLKAFYIQKATTDATERAAEILKSPEPVGGDSDDLPF
jgi:hypothetical protein